MKKEKFLQKFMVEKERIAEIKTVEMQGTIKKSENGVFYLQDENGKKYLFEIPLESLEIENRLIAQVDTNFSKYGIELKLAYENLNYSGVIYPNSVIKIIESPKEIRTNEFQTIFDNQKENGFLDELTLNSVCEWILHSLETNEKVKTVVIQAFGMTDNRPDQWNVPNYRQYLQEIVNTLKSEYEKNHLPILIIITGPNGANDSIGIAGSEGVETALELEKMLKIVFGSEADSEDFVKNKVLLLPVGMDMEYDKVDYVRNLWTAKQIMEQINQQIKQKLENSGLKIVIEEFWTDSVRSWKHIACLMCLQMDFTKVKTAERIEVDENGKPSENQNWLTQTRSIGMIVWIIFQRFVQNKLTKFKE